MNNVSFIYRIINTKNGRFYIGSTSNFEKRKYCHFKELQKNIHANGFLQNDFNRCGIEQFEMEILIEVPTENQFKIEQEILDEVFDNKVLCYNINPIVCVPPSRKGSVASEESKRKMSLSAIGKPKSEETKARMAASKLGKKRKPFSIEARQKMSQSAMGNKNWIKKK